MPAPEDTRRYAARTATWLSRIDATELRQYGRWRLVGFLYPGEVAGGDGETGVGVPRHDHARGQEHPHPGRQSGAGLVFFNDEATETGGLIFAGASSTDSISSGVHLSFDNHEQDQVVVLSSSDDGPERRFAQLEFVDRPDWSFVDLVQVDTTDHDAVEQFFDSRPTPVKRMRLAREPDGSVGLTLRDAVGRPRIVLRVPADADPFIEVLDPDGNTVSRMPETSACLLGIVKSALLAVAKRRT